MEFYTESQKQLQSTFDSRRLAERVEEAIVTDVIVPELHQPFIESRDFFFLATVNARGEPTVSHKGGPVGVVTVVDGTTLAFPSYDGNGMFLSMGNIAETGKIGMLFIDLKHRTECASRPRRRVVRTIRFWQSTQARSYSCGPR